MKFAASHGQLVSTWSTATLVSATVNFRKTSAFEIATTKFTGQFSFDLFLSNFFVRQLCSHIPPSPTNYMYSVAERSASYLWKHLSLPVVIRARSWWQNKVWGINKMEQVLSRRQGYHEDPWFLRTLDSLVQLKKNSVMTLWKLVIYGSFKFINSNHYLATWRADLYFVALNFTYFVKILRLILLIISNFNWFRIT